MRKQCRKCPWKVGVDPYDIPNGYSEEAHAALESTIATTAYIGDQLHMMACHKTAVGDESPCIGWMHHQAGVGNNLALRLAIMCGHVLPGEIVGEQHQNFEDTLPNGRGHLHSDG